MSMMANETVFSDLSFTPGFLKKEVPEILIEKNEYLG